MPWGGESVVTHQNDGELKSKLLKTLDTTDK